MAPILLLGLALTACGSGHSTAKGQAIREIAHAQSSFICKTFGTNDEGCLYYSRIASGTAED